MYYLTGSRVLSNFRVIARLTPCGKIGLLASFFPLLVCERVEWSEQIGGKAVSFSPRQTPAVKECERILFPLGCFSFSLFFTLVTPFFSLFSLGTCQLLTIGETL